MVVIDEGFLSGFNLLMVLVIDDDSGDMLQYSFLGINNVDFVILSSIGFISIVKSLDYEIVILYVFIVLVQDGKIIVIIFLIIIVNNKNDVFVFKNVLYLKVVDENDVGVFVYIVSVIDQDIVDSLWYFFFGLGLVDFVLYFFIGVIILFCVFNYELIFLYFLLIFVFDSNGESLIMNFEVIVNDLNELLRFVVILYSVSIDENF